MLVRSRTAITIWDLDKHTTTPTTCLKWLLQTGIFVAKEELEGKWEGGKHGLGLGPLVEAEQRGQRGQTCHGLWYRHKTDSRRWVSARIGSWFEGRHFSDRMLLWILYQWCHKTPLVNIQIKLGLTESNHFHGLIKQFQQRIITHDPAPRLGLNNGASCIWGASSVWGAR